MWPCKVSEMRFPFASAVAVSGAADTTGQAAGERLLLAGERPIAWSPFPSAMTEPSAFAMNFPAPDALTLMPLSVVQVREGDLRGAGGQEEIRGTHRRSWSTLTNTLATSCVPWIGNRAVVCGLGEGRGSGKTCASVSPPPGEGRGGRHRPLQSMLSSAPSATITIRFASWR